MSLKRVAILFSPALLAGCLLMPMAGHADPSLTPVAYSALPPATHGAAPSGWGLSATVSGRSMDLQTRTLEWVNNTAVRSGDADVGFGWRRRGSSIVLGYEQRGVTSPAPDFGPKRDLGRRSDNPGYLGLNLTLRHR